MAAPRRRKPLSDQRGKNAHLRERANKPAAGAADELAAGLADQGQRALSRIKDQLTSYPLGDFVIVNVETSEHVIAHTLTQAVDLFTTRFPNAKGGYVHRIGEAAV